MWPRFSSSAKVSRSSNRRSSLDRIDPPTASTSFANKIATATSTRAKARACPSLRGQHLRIFVFRHPETGLGGSRTSGRSRRLRKNRSGLQGHTAGFFADYRFKPLSRPPGSGVADTPCRARICLHREETQTNLGGEGPACQPLANGWDIAGAPAPACLSAEW